MGGTCNEDSATNIHEGLMRRREFLTKLGVASAASLINWHAGAENVTVASADQAGSPMPASRMAFETSDVSYARTYEHALSVLRANCVQLPNYRRPVLIEGSSYRGVWLECGPHESLVYSLIRPDIARNTHMAFFDTQRADGQFPDAVKESQIGWSQIQMVVPIAATAWELAQQTGDDELLTTAYRACTSWDAWLHRWRNTRGTGLCEGFCTYDTGHDNSPRWAGVPNACPDRDARKCPTLPGLPRLCPDLSATVFGGRIALASMAHALGKDSEADAWRASAESIRKAIIDRLYSSEDAAFYDLDAQDKFVRIRGDAISRVLGEHVVDRKLFTAIWEKQIHSSECFWTSYPLPSIAVNDPAFLRPKSRNSWGGAAQALTALRAPRWMEHYGHPAELAYMMQQWTSAIVRAGEFLQQMDPITGFFTPDRADYSPAALVFLDYTWRLSGVRLLGEYLEWNVRPSSSNGRFRLRVTPSRIAEIQYQDGRARLLLNDRVICSVRQTARITTDSEGKLLSVTGISSTPQDVLLEGPGTRQQKVHLPANGTVHLA